MRSGPTSDMGGRGSSAGAAAPSNELMVPNELIFLTVPGPCPCRNELLVISGPEFK